jgi:hypothetical protein
MPVIIIGPGGLLLVVPHIFAVVTVSLSWVGCKEVKSQTWMRERIFFQGHILSSTAREGYSKRIKLLIDQGREVREEKKQKKNKKNPIFILKKSLDAKNSAPGGLVA